jgi:hypothetical protein
MSGYMHPDYAGALAEFGTPCHLPYSDGWILVSSIDGSSTLDARGCYPFFTCRHWSRISKDLEAVKHGLVSLVLVTDPFGDFDPAVLSDYFPDFFKPYKEHYVVDLNYPLDQIISSHHARNLRKGQNLIEVERCIHPLKFVQQWNELYANLTKRHNIKGISEFSARSFYKQLKVPGLEMFRAILKKETVGLMLCYVQGDVGYYHLSAYSKAGYKHRASYALFAYVLAYFAARLRWFSLGAGAGAYNDGKDGLTRFKSGWATGTRTVYICGRVFDQTVYNDITCSRAITGGDFFPLYRKGEIL